MRADAIIQIKEGDNLYNLAKEHNVTVEQLVKWNDIKDPSKMSAGNYLKVNETSRTETFEKEDESVEIISNENE